jgi:hypothetical protein
VHEDRGRFLAVEAQVNINDWILVLYVPTMAVIVLCAILMRKK